MLVLAFALFLAPGNDFGQREHLLIGLALPGVLRAVGRMNGRPAPGGPAVAAGVLAGLGLAIKPRMLLTIYLPGVLLVLSRPNEASLRAMAPSGATFTEIPSRHPGGGEP